MTPEDKLRAHDVEFEKRIYPLAPDVYLAVGYAASNVGLIIGTDGLIIVDTTESTAAAEQILAGFREITDKPVRTIIYTHSHRDHISGATVFAEGAEVEIIAHPEFESDLVGAETRPGPNKILLQRTARQFGIGLEAGTERINLGLGPGDRPMKGMGQGFLPPTRAVTEDGQVLDRCGTRLRFHFAPGECADTIAVELPAKGLLFSGDNFYASFPNLYAIRGTPYRDFTTWADSLAKLAALKPTVLAPGHTRPILGAAEIQTALADYEAAIRSVIEQTAAGMNAGLTPDALVQTVALPEPLRAKPYLQEYYGTVAWAVRAYFAGTLGWFDGDPATLFSLPPAEEADRLAALAGGPSALDAAATRAFEAGDLIWTLKLCAAVLRLDLPEAQAGATRIAALRALARQQENACARNYLLHCAKQAEKA
ncbi:alkyl sulfatase dimerization domain-containing protein [Dinoroseobacter sp. S76]|uniref:alkyl sulfatase dimerization domain-containing protein n=1 Tax=Dinoroseobacter sp. S76 TaxID=3415124 RepID=UPI003C7ADDE7